MPAERIGAEELFRRHAAEIGRFFRMLGVRGPSIEDLVQQVFLIVHRKGGYEVGPARPMTWLRAIAVRVASDFRKSERRRRLDLDDQAIEAAASKDATPEDAAASQEEIGGLSRALASLSFDHRAVFVLFELERESFETIAGILNIPTGTVGSRLSTARARVLEQYRPQATSTLPGPADRADQRSEAADPTRLRLDPATSAPLREDLAEAAGAEIPEASKEIGEVERSRAGARIERLLLQLGVAREDLGALTEQVFLVAERLGGYEEQGSAATRLREIAVHLALDQERRRPRAAAAAGGAALPRLLRCLGGLGFRQRAVLVLFEIEGESCASIGKILDNTAPDAVRTSLHAARRSILEAYRAPQLSAGSRGGVT